MVYPCVPGETSKEILDLKFSNPESSARFYIQHFFIYNIHIGCKGAERCGYIRLGGRVQRLGQTWEFAAWETLEVAACLGACLFVCFQ